MARIIVFSMPDVFQDIVMRTGCLNIIRFSATDFIEQIIECYYFDTPDYETVSVMIEDMYFSCANDINQYPGGVPMEEDMYSYTVMASIILDRVHRELSPHLDYYPDFYFEKIIIRGGQVILHVN